MTIRAHRWALLLLVPSAACFGRDLDRPWGLGEARRVHRSPADLAPQDDDERQLAIYLPLGVSRRFVALDAREALVVGDGASVVEPRTEHAIPAGAMVASLGSLAIGSGARVGSTYVLGDPLQLEPESIVDGYLKSASGLSGAQDRARGGALGGVEPYVEEFRWDLDRVAASQNVRASGASPADLPPAAYAEVVVDDGATVVVRSGTTTIDALDVRDGGALAIDNSAGPVYLWVRRSLVLHGSMVDYVLQPNILVGYAGTASPDLTSPFRATLVAPNADVRLPRTPEPHSGSFFARSIAVDPGAVVEHRPFATSAPIEPLAYVRRRCVVTAREAERRADVANDAERGARAVATGADDPAELEVFALQKTTSVLDGCPRRYGYRPDTCAKLGYPAHLPGRCP